MGQFAVDLDGVAEGVAEIKYLPDTMVVRVGLHHAGFDAGHLLDSGQWEVGRGKHLMEQRGVGDGGGLHHLHQAVGHFLLWKRLQEGRFYDRQGGRVEVAYAVFHATEIDGRLATDGRVDHAQ